MKSWGSPSQIGPLQHEKLQIIEAVENIGDVSDVQLAINWLLDHGTTAFTFRYFFTFVVLVY